jgi:hypothetical protein
MRHAEEKGVAEAHARAKRRLRLELSRTLSLSQLLLTAHQKPSGASSPHQRPSPSALQAPSPLSAMSLTQALPDDLPVLGVPISRLPGIIEDLGGAAKAGALSCGEYFAKCIRPVCKANGLPLAQQIAMKDESTRSGKARCARADTLVVQGGGHGFMHSIAALTLHTLGHHEPAQEDGPADRARAAQVRWHWHCIRACRDRATVTLPLLVLFFAASWPQIRSRASGWNACATATASDQKASIGGSSGFPTPCAPPFTALCSSWLPPKCLTCRRQKRLR